MDFPMRRLAATTAPRPSSGSRRCPRCKALPPALRVKRGSACRPRGEMEFDSCFICHHLSHHHNFSVHLFAIMLHHLFIMFLIIFQQFKALFTFVSPWPCSRCRPSARCAACGCCNRPIPRTGRRRWYPQSSSIYNGIFHSKPSVLGYPHDYGNPHSGSTIYKSMDYSRMGPPR